MYVSIPVVKFGRGSASASRHHGVLHSVEPEILLTSVACCEYQSIDEVPDRDMSDKDSLVDWGVNGHSLKDVDGCFRSFVTRVLMSGTVTPRVGHLGVEDDSSDTLYSSILKLETLCLYCGFDVGMVEMVPRAMWWLYPFVVWSDSKFQVRLNRTSKI